MTEHNNKPLPEAMSQMLAPQFKAYPYMFAGPTLELAMSSGWYAPFAQLCDAIDVALGEDKHGFHWVQLKEKFGQPRWYWELEDEAGMQGDLWLDLQVGDPRQRMTFCKEVPGELRARIRALVDSAMDACCQRCMDCGAPALGYVIRGSVMVLCEAHAKHRQQDTPNQDL